MRFTCEIEITHERETREADWADWREAAVLHTLTSDPSSARVRRTYHPQTTDTVQDNLYGGPKTALRSWVQRTNVNFQFEFEKQIHLVARRQLPDFWAFFVVNNALKKHTRCLENEYVVREKWACFGWQDSPGKLNFSKTLRSIGTSSVNRVPKNSDPGKMCWPIW